MTPTWFNTPERIATLDTVARGWLGTPFRTNSAVRGAGGGVSCHNLIGEIYFEVGALERFKLPIGHPREIANRIDEVITDYIDQHLATVFAAIDPLVEAGLPGDLILMRDHRRMMHLGVMLEGGMFVHVLATSHGVMISMAQDPTFGRKIEKIRRLLP